MTVRPATPDDVTAIADLELDNLGDDAWSEGLVREGVTGNLPTISYLVVEVDTPTGRSVAGHATASVVADIAELQRIAVDPAHRRTGLASLLLDAVIGAARAGGADRLLLEVREDNAAALAFYAARGFVEVDRRRRYYRDGTTAVVMRRSLGRGCGASDHGR
ncbi:ribosomal-protein-alanine acetyltransferase [Nocardioides sp. Root1257]|uniref:GNAT family N-acetyltransferase n=1 Tax=unclassified Nocardioides TaxID=2615069 RepID=UPI0006FFA7BC|nr:MULTISPECIES: N-acetyltransferase [unclassified Nocardioides]KQW49155.1 ribosomal-protein-alanine acetyltransferase [Nocardioides sp. Root1257]KRC48329.1 ribosomal-protein-alanine acetyltransferase [Nocardioides sp. Root224]